MVAFVTEYKKRTKEVYLPEGDWFNFWTNEEVSGNTKVTVDAAFDNTPIFVKAGSIIPMGPKIQYATQDTKEPLTIKIYPGKDTSYVLYMDDNETYKYEEGEFSEINFLYSESNKTLNIKNGLGAYIDFNQNPIDFIIEVVGENNKETAIFKGNEITISL